MNNLSDLAEKSSTTSVTSGGCSTSTYQPSQRAGFTAKHQSPAAGATERTIFHCFITHCAGKMTIRLALFSSSVTAPGW